MLKGQFCVLNEYERIYKIHVERPFDTRILVGNCETPKLYSHPNYINKKRAFAYAGCRHTALNEKVNNCPFRELF